jgi:hypothetical protein
MSQRSIIFNTFIQINRLNTNDAPNYKGGGRHSSGHGFSRAPKKNIGGSWKLPRPGAVIQARPDLFVFFSHNETTISNWRMHLGTVSFIALHRLQCTNLTKFFIGPVILNVAESMTRFTKYIFILFLRKK